MARRSLLSEPWKPTPLQIAAARGRRVPDIMGPGLSVLFCGINPGLYSGAVGHHFARPGNRFWPTLHLAGFTPRRFSAFESRGLLELGYGITNLVARATASADELSPSELLAGRRLLERKLRRYRPRAIAVLGVTAYRTAFGAPNAMLGRQPSAEGEPILWVLPNPSGLNAHFQLASLARLFSELRRAAHDG